MKFTSERAPNLYVRDLDVRFVDGVAEADGKTAEALRSLPAEYGVQAASGGKSAPTEPDSEQPPAKSPRGSKRG